MAEEDPKDQAGVNNIQHNTLMTIGMVNLEIARHMEAIQLLMARIHQTSTQELGGTLPEEADLRTRLQALDTMTGEMHSRLAQVRALRWARKQLHKEAQTHNHNRNEPAQ